MNKKIVLMYLNRKAEGDTPVKRFVDSYRAFDPGVEHELITIYKGFSDSELAPARINFQDIESRHIVVDDNMTDIDAYLIAAEAFPDADVFCFLNTFSEIVCAKWLLSLYKAISTDNVGIAGATASYESMLNSSRLISKVTWACNNNYLKYDAELYRQYKSIMDQHARRWLQKNTWRRFISTLRSRQADYSYLAEFDAEFEVYWGILTAPDAVYEFLKDYPSFPNPHIRSNGFMIAKVHLSPFFRAGKRMTKKESYLFESGANGLTRQMQNKGLRAVVVNGRGEIFDVNEWPKSGTFRLGLQQELLIHDNQTRNFKHLSAAEKDILAYMTWGDALQYSTKGLYTFSMPFGSNS